MVRPVRYALPMEMPDHARADDACALHTEEDVRAGRTLSVSSAAPSTSSASRETSPGVTSINSEAYSSSTRPGSDSSSRDPLGLKVVYRPVGQRRVDIVFVHGLGGSSQLTWCYNRDRNLFWPLKFLPSDPVISEARIFTFGYNANFRPGSGSAGNRMSILDFAKDLLWQLKYARDESADGNLRMGERPIIFIAHSMGGLVVKEAYLRGQIDPGYASIVKAIISIIFLSTPHRGNNLAETLNKILQVSFAASPMQFISELSAGSQTIRSLNEDFRHIAPRLGVYSFYETHPTPLVGSGKIRTMVVDRDSSVLGYAGEETKPLNADHHGVCKYASPSDPAYIDVSNVIKTVIEKVPRPEPFGAKLAEYLSLSKESLDADYSFFQERCTPGTCTWILGNATLTGWMEDMTPKPRVLWVRGNPGSGKSVLSSFLIQHVLNSGVPCHYFFFRFMSQEKRGMSMMLRSLAYQLAESTPAYAAKIQQLEAAGTQLRTADYRNIWLLLFKQALFQIDHLDRPLYLAIDGVDEADRPASVIKLLADLHLTSLPIRLLLVSRPTDELSSAFEELAMKVKTGTIHIEGNPTDFRAYIDEVMKRGRAARHREYVTNQLLERAKGNFLWVHLAVQQVKSLLTKEEIETALTKLPSGMEALYDRMALSVAEASDPSNPELGRTILSWVACAQRLLTVEELRDALGDETGVLEAHSEIIHRCGGFVTVDQQGRVAMIHETAREYLTSGAEKGRGLAIDVRSTNDTLLRCCIALLADEDQQREYGDDGGRPLAGYAATAWPHHLALSSALTDMEILDTVTDFLRGRPVLTWISIAARMRELRAMVIASRRLADLSAKLREKKEEDDSVAGRQAAAVMEGWATDLVKILGKFGSNLVSHPDAIYNLIPPFCPEDSMIYRQFVDKRLQDIRVSGRTGSTWDDCLARFSLTPGAVASSVITAGGRIGLLSLTRNTSQIIIYSSATLEELRRLSHPERVLAIQANKLGDMLVSYGYATTRVWDVATGDCLKVIRNPPERPRPHSIIFKVAEQETTVVVCDEDRCIRSFSLDDDATEWTVRSHINEKKLVDTFPNFPMCSALHPDGRRVAFGYRNYPLTVWDLGKGEGPKRVGLCYNRLDETDMTVAKTAWGAVYQVAWHPLRVEVFGLSQVGLLFRWNPYEKYPSAEVRAGGNSLAVNHDGSLVATGDGTGNIRIFASADFSKIYQLSSQDPVLSLTFSTDSRQLYDVRGLYGNVWEPNTLVRLADCPDHSSDSNSETESLAKASLLSEHHVAEVDGVTCLAVQSFGPLYCYGTENGVVMLCEAGRGSLRELARLASYMSIENVAWSDDWKLVAFTDLIGRLTVKRVNRSVEHRDMLDVSHEFDVTIPLADGDIISQLIFDPTGSKIFAAAPGKMFSVDIASRTITEFAIEPEVKWAFHPSRPDTLLGFGNTQLHVVDCHELREVGLHTYFPLRDGASSTISIPSADNARSESLSKDTEKLGKLITNASSHDVLLEISASTSPGQAARQYLLFDLDDLQLEQDNPDNPGRLRYTVLDSGISSRIREPLAILSQRRLTFLDVDRWICTWELSSADSDGFTGVKQHYFLPSDWVTGHDTHLCAAAPDGTLLCPYNGAVVTVGPEGLQEH
ncbi:hypothetical protein C8A03DRAFT_44164 [Achaetomium macrosporum]|uniref:GPI inositol-deacylase n=1 Tax=Achaetomium macrosporum TaxID=79813 RepID=A0AAN7H705_9PEZI|nr:hypothetical protein C8A03DRAFT_44164 [Achaetomium macrosporum]